MARLEKNKPQNFQDKETHRSLPVQESQEGFGICYLSIISDTSKKLRFDIHMFNLNCLKEGRKFDYSGDMMHAFVVIVDCWALEYLKIST